MCGSTYCQARGGVAPSEAVLQCELHNSCRTSGDNLPEGVAAHVRGGLRKIGTIEYVLCFGSEFHALTLFDPKQSRQACVDDQSPWAANRTRRHICMGAGSWFRKCPRIQPVGVRSRPGQTIAIHVRENLICILSDSIDPVSCIINARDDGKRTSTVHADRRRGPPVARNRPQRPVRKSRHGGNAAHIGYMLSVSPAAVIHVAPGNGAIAPVTSPRRSEVDTASAGACLRKRVHRIADAV